MAVVYLCTCWNTSDRFWAANIFSLCDVQTGSEAHLIPYREWVQGFLQREKSGWSAKLTVNLRLEQELVIPGATDVYSRSLYIRVVLNWLIKHNVIKSIVTVSIAVALGGEKCSASRCGRFIAEGNTDVRSWWRGFVGCRADADAGEEKAGKGLIL